MIVYLTFDQVLAIHEVVMQGDSRLRDAGLIQSAVSRPHVTAFGEDAYGSIWEKAAALMQSLARNHGFIDGNKRTAWAAAMTFLEVNGHSLDPSFNQQAAEQLVIAIAQGAYGDVPSIASELVKFTV